MSSMTIKELENSFWTITMTLLGYDTTDTTLQDKVRMDWPTQGQPAFDVDEDVIFLKVLPFDDNYNRIRDMSYKVSDSSDTTLVETYSYTRVIGVTWVCYGPNSNTNAQIIRNKMFYDTFNAGMELLDSYGLYLVSDIKEPTRIPEEFNNLWWERTDLSMQFNYLVSDDVEVPSVNSVPVEVNGEDFIIEVD